MRLTYPHFANLTMPMKWLLEKLDCDVVLESHNKRSLQLGVQNAPELMCIPFKLALGHTLYMIDKHQNLDSCAIICENHPCRICSYGILFEAIIKEKYKNINVLNYNYSEVFNLTRQLKRIGGEGTSWLQFVRYYFIAIRKLDILDQLERMLIKIRASEKKVSATELYYTQAYNDVYKADSLKTLNAIFRHYQNAMLENWDQNNRSYVRVLIVGEMDCQTNYFLNFNIQKKVNLMGIEVERSFWLSQVINDFFHLMGSDKSNKNEIIRFKTIRNESKAYFEHNIGAELTVGASVLCAKQRYNGIIHVMPFACTLETTAATALRIISINYNIPILTLLLDEQTGEAGIVTRLEAFVDLLLQKHKRISRAVIRSSR